MAGAVLGPGPFNFEKQSTRRSRVLTPSKLNPCHPERSTFGAPITLGVIGVSGVEGPAFQEAAVRDNHVRFALIENEERTRQALHGIKAMLAKGVAPA